MSKQLSNLESIGAAENGGETLPSESVHNDGEVVNKQQWTMVTMRVERERKARWEAAADRANQTLFLWSLEALDAAAVPGTDVETAQAVTDPLRSGHAKSCGCGWCLTGGGGGA